MKHELVDNYMAFSPHKNNSIPQQSNDIMSTRINGIIPPHSADKAGWRLCAGRPSADCQLQH